MTTDQITAMKLACKAFYIREGRTGLNTWDNEAYAALKTAVKLFTGELYASGEWYKDQWNKGVNV